ncbi:MAG: hypothetical protein HY228_00480 [Candidatus Yonathbacteria bacterium]|nr:hypothetical protein [Candidatus Yonathbacteria bacterium]
MPIFEERSDYKNGASRPQGEAIPTEGTNVKKTCLTDTVHLLGGVPPQKVLRKLRALASSPCYGEDTDIAKRIFKVGKVKWTFNLPIYTTGRRLQEEGIITMGIKYVVNYIWPILFSKPFTREYKDIRE